MVSLRLYARSWGPASIVQALNDHRLIEPPYLRNTCSVKCTTAMKSGKKIFGENWENEFRAVFAGADDGKATDLMRTNENSVDYDVRALSTNLKGFPAGEDAGIFTHCVKYCIENNAPYTMSNVHQLAMSLQNGMVPQHPASPCDVVTPTHLRAEAPDDEDIKSYFVKDGGVETLSPAADKTSYLYGFGAYGSSTDLDAPQK
ncbi:hypothetical protein B5807_02823 [Epicoccum nigrum]|uniref:Uncharacterized protein n=1 Tax=Epicoccum nigrum TaxID=105696 RepID=A0A1Y2M9U4_EPING|nr:hypothetical protein B5807_02823 [Epicoccum nigrum]